MVVFASVDSAAIEIAGINLLPLVSSVINNDILVFITAACRAATASNAAYEIKLTNKPTVRQDLNKIMMKCTYCCNDSEYRCPR